MKYRLTNNLGLKLLSVFFAIGLWFIVVNVDDPVSTKSFKNIPVSFKNENLLIEEGKLFQVLDNSNLVTFTVRAKRSVLESLKNDDFRAEADFAERISENSVPIKVSALRYEDDILDIDLQKNTVKIQIEEQVSKTISVELQVVGSAAEGLTVGNTQISPSEITLTGPESVVNNVKNMVVVLDASNASNDIDTTIAGQLFNESGEVVSDDRIVCDANEFNVKAKLLHTKSVDLDFSVEGNVKEGYRYIDMEYEPTTVLIAGEQEDLDKISTIQFPPSLLNIEGADNNVVKKVNVSDFLPPNLIVANENENEIEVKLNIVSLITQEVAYPVTKIDVLNTPTGLDVSFEGNLALTFVLQGLQEDLSGMSLDDIKVSVDVKGLGAGTHRIKADIGIIGNVEVVEDPIVEVTLSSSVSNDSGDSVTENNNGYSEIDGVGSN